MADNIIYFLENIEENIEDYAVYIALAFVLFLMPWTKIAGAALGITTQRAKRARKAAAEDKKQEEQPRQKQPKFRKSTKSSKNNHPQFSIRTPTRGSGESVDLSKIPEGKHPWDQDFVFAEIYQEHNLLLRDMLDGMACFGGKGSGKTAGLLANAAHSALACGHGGMVLTVEDDDASKWQKWARQHGREEDIIVINPENHCLNFLDYEERHPGKGHGNVENLVALFMQVVEVHKKKDSGDKDGFWKESMKQMLRNAIFLLKFAGEEISISKINKMITLAPRSKEDLSDPQWQKGNLFFDCLCRADDAHPEGSENYEDWEVIEDYWTREFPDMPDVTRGGVIANFTAPIAPFLTGDLRKLFSTKTSVIPEMCLSGKVLVIDLPVNQWREQGKMAQAIFKFLFQRMVNDRPEPAPHEQRQTRPLFLIADEAQFFVTSTDSEYESTARKHKAWTLYCSQSKPGFIKGLGGGEAGKSEFESLMGNMLTKFFFQNPCSETNKYCSELIAKTLQTRVSYSENANTQRGEQQGSSTGASTQEVVDYELQPREMQLLAIPKDHPGYCEAVIFQRGQVFPTGKAYCRAWLEIPGWNH